MSENVAKRF